MIRVYANIVKMSTAKFSKNTLFRDEIKARIDPHLSPASAGVLLLKLLLITIDCFINDYIMLTLSCCCCCLFVPPEKKKKL